VDNMQDNTKSNADHSGENNKDYRDPMIQARDDSNISRQESQPAAIIPGDRKRISLADATLLPAQFMGTRGSMQAVPSVGDVIKSMLRFKWTILVVFVIIAVPAVAAIWTLLVPRYQAQAEVRVRPIIPYLVFRTEDSGMIPLYDSFVNTQVSIIRSTIVLQRVLDQPEIQETQWYKEPSKSIISKLFGTKVTPLERLRNDLSARPRPRTEIIDVSFITYNVKEAQLITNTVLDHYIKYIQEMSDTTQDNLYRQLVDQYKDLEKEISGQETIAAKLRRTLGTGAPDELISGMRVRLDETQARLGQVRQDIALLEWEMQQAAANDGNDVQTAATDRIQSQPKYYEDQEWRRLDANVRMIRHKIDTSLLTPNHRDAVQAQKELEFAEEQLQQREKQLDEQWRDRLNNPAASSLTIAGVSGLSYEEGLIYLEHQLARSKREEQLLADELKKQQAEFAGLFESAQLLERENTALQHTRELFSVVRQRRDQKTMERNVPGSIEILTRARAFTQPYNDRRVVFTAMVLVMALGAGCGLAYLRANRTQAIYTPKDMPHQMQVPFLGYIPATFGVGSPYDQTNAATIESIRVVRTALLSRLNGQDSTSVLITSAAEGTGKSTFTMLLGESLARSGKKVLLIDADFRKMTLTKHFKLSGHPGFIQSLSSRSQEQYHIFKTEQIPGLSFMPAGKHGNYSPAFEETANGDFKIHIDKLRNQFDFILLDSPPVLPVADAVILSNQVDGVIIVERELISRRTDVINALARLSSAGGRLLGTVFIGSDQLGKSGYVHYYSKTGESNYSESKKPV
jgi:succinoglycan biosynthesis transport protein ExoP